MGIRHEDAQRDRNMRLGPHKPSGQGVECETGRARPVAIFNSTNGDQVTVTDGPATSTPAQSTLVSPPIDPLTWPTQKSHTKTQPSSGERKLGWVIELLVFNTPSPVWCAFTSTYSGVSMIDAVPK